jgi:FMN reductase
MGALRAVAVSGSPRSPSKSRTLAEAALAVLAEQGFETSVIDVASLPAEALLARTEAREIEEAIAAVGGSDIVVGASPTYRALYTGALKAFFDLMPPGHLKGKVCIGLQTGIAAEHFLAAEYGFRPLFASLDGVPAAVLYATDGEFAEGAPSEGLLGRVREVAIAAAQAARRA